MKKFCVLFICLAILLSSTAFASSLTTVDINQIVQKGDQLYVFFHTLDENSECLSGIESGQIKLELSNQVLTPEMQSTGEGTAFVFAIDVSASLSAEQFAAVKSGIQEYVNNLGNKDQMAIVTFGTEVVTVSDFTDNKNALNAIINGLEQTSGGTTLYAGILRSIDLAKRQNNQLPMQRVIVVVSDGEDWADESNIQEVQSSATNAGISICAVGINTGSNSEGLASMGTLARSTGGTIFTRDEDEISDGFNSLRSYISGGYVVSATIPSELADGTEEAIVLTVSNGGFTVDDGVDFRIKNISDVADVAVDNEAAEETEEVLDEAEWQEQDGFETDTADELNEVETTEQSPLEENPEITTADIASGEITDPEDVSASTANSSTLYIYIGCAVAVIMGVGVFLFFFLKKKKGKKIKPSNYDEGYGYGGGNGETGTVPLGDSAETGTMPLDGYMGGSEIVLTDQLQGRSYTVKSKNKISIGRRDGINDIVLRDSAVSGTHCEIIRDGGHLYVKDCDSHNGTFVISNGLRYQADSISGQEVMLGDEIELGHTRLELSQC